MVTSVNTRMELLQHKGKEWCLPRRIFPRRSIFENRKLYLYLCASVFRRENFRHRANISSDNFFLDMVGG